MTMTQETLNELLFQGGELSDTLLEKYEKLYKSINRALLIKGLKCGEGELLSESLKKLEGIGKGFEYCDDCGSTDIGYNEYDKIVCKDCGVVQLNQEIQVFSDDEIRAYTKDEVQKRKRTEVKWKDFGPRTIIPKQDGKNIVNNKNLYSRLAKIQNSLLNSFERNLWEATPKMKQYAGILNLPYYIREDAMNIYKACVRGKHIQGRSIDQFLFSSLYAAAKVNNHFLIMDDILNVSEEIHIFNGVEYKSGVSKRKLVRAINILKTKILPELNITMENSPLIKYIFKFMDELDLEKHKIKALNLLEDYALHYYLSEKYEQVSAEVIKLIEMKSEGITAAKVSADLQSFRKTGELEDIIIVTKNAKDNNARKVEIEKLALSKFSAHYKEFKQSSGIISEFVEPIMSGKDPKGFASGFIYLYVKRYAEKKTQKEVAEICNITEVTLRTRKKEILKNDLQNMLKTD